MAARSDEPNYLNLQLPSTLLSFMLSFSSLLSSPQLRLFWFTQAALIVLFSATARSCFQ